MAKDWGTGMVFLNATAQKNGMKAETLRTIGQSCASSVFLLLFTLCAGEKVGLCLVLEWAGSWTTRSWVENAPC